MLTKLTLLSLMTLMLSPVANADVNSAAPTNATADEGCKDEMIAFRPGGRTLKAAASSFAFEAQHAIAACAVQEKVKVSKDQHMYVTGYRKLNGGRQVIFYQIDNFKDGFGTTEETCRVTVRTVHTGVPHWDSFATVVSKPVCKISALK